jgi:hypothetical protein
MATCKFNSTYILALAKLKLEKCTKEREEVQKAIREKYIKQHFFLSWVLFWLKPLTHEKIKDDINRYLTLSELITYELTNLWNISFYKSIVNMCTDSINDISLTSDEYLRLKPFN